MKTPSRIMIAEDEGIVAMDIQEALRSADYGVLGVAATGREAVDKATQTRPDLVLMDIHLNGDMDGIQAAREIRARLDIPVIYLTAYSDQPTLERAKMTEPFGYLLKPFEKEDLRASIEMALHRHRTERTVKESRRWMEEILRGAGEAIVATDARGFVTFMNPAAEQLTGRTAWASGPSWTDVLGLKRGGEAPLVLSRAFERGTAAEFPPETALLGGDGETRSVGGVLSPVRDRAGRLTGFVMAFRDVTERRRLEEDLKRDNDELALRVRDRTETLSETNRELERHLKEADALYKYAPCGYHSLDRDGLVVRMNQTELNWLGRRIEEVLDRPFVELLVPGSRVTFLKNMDIFRARGWMRDVEYEMLRRDGSSFPVLFNAQAAPGEGGAEVRVTVYDMSEKKRAERELSDSESKFRCIAESAAESILLSDEKGVIMFANRAARRLFARPQEELLGESVDALVPERQRRRFKDVLKTLASLEPGSPPVSLTALRGQDRSGREFAVEASVASWTAGERRYYAAILRDISERRRLEAALLHAGKLSAMGQMAAGLAHELKTPLGTIYSYSDVLLGKVRDPEVSSTLETIQRQALRCAGLIDNLLDFARRHKMSPSEMSDMGEVIESALSLVESHAKTRAVAVKRESAHQPFPVRGAKNMLEQVVINLCMNAIDAMPGGGILTVRAFPAGAPEHPCVRVEVADTGTGIPEEIRDTLFEPFQTTKEPGHGTGLGLWLVREIVEGVGGSISYESAPERGTVFILTLPLREPPSAGEA